MLQFEVYERKESMTSHGTIIEIVGENGKIDFLKSNLADPNKRVVVILQRADGTSKMVTCSLPVSDGIRNKTIELGHLLNFEILEGESGVPYVSMPGGGLISINVKDIKAKELKVKAVAFEDYI
jgi:hypothetical protein